MKKYKAFNNKGNWIYFDDTKYINEVNPMTLCKNTGYSDLEGTCIYSNDLVVPCYLSKFGEKTNYQDYEGEGIVWISDEGAVIYQYHKVEKLPLKLLLVDDKTVRCIVVGNTFNNKLDYNIKQENKSFRGVDMISGEFVYGDLVRRDTEYFIMDGIDFIDQEITYNSWSIGCGIEDRGITNRYEAAEYGFFEAKSQYEDNKPELYKVIPESVGISTGYYNSKGTEIFVGDKIITCKKDHVWDVIEINDVNNLPKEIAYPEDIHYVESNKFDTLNQSNP